MDLSNLFSYSRWVEIAGSEFRLGFLCALLAVMALFVTLLLLQLLIYLFWRSCGVREVVIRHADGNITIALAAIAAAIAPLCRNLGEITVSKLKIYRLHRGRYRLDIYGTLTSSGVENDFSAAKTAIREGLTRCFGFDRVTKINFRLENFTLAPLLGDEKTVDSGVGESPAAGTAPQADK